MKLVKGAPALSSTVIDVPTLLHMHWTFVPVTFEQTRQPAFIDSECGREEDPFLSPLFLPLSSLLLPLSSLPGGSTCALYR